MSSSDPQSRPVLVVSEEPLTIVVPVYNALEETTRCLDALAATVDPETRIVVIDDASSDPEVLPALTSMTAAAGFELMVNPENLGFVGTCNRGFAEIAEGHVLILNSDTQPLPGWLEAMTAAIEPDVASVTAVSNAASIYSLPGPGAAPFSDDFAPADLADIVRRVVTHVSIDIPVAVGFCMLLTRRALDVVGHFDTAFGIGYGEENDWCMRAMRAGFRHVLAPRAFVFHEGGVSMSSAGVLPKGSGTHPENERILLERYPEYPELVTRFLAQPAVHGIRHAVAEGMLKDLRRRRIHALHWLHANPFDTGGGGTEGSVARFIEDTEREYAATVVYPDPSRGVASVVEVANGVKRERVILVGERPTGLRRSSEIWKGVAEGILHDLNPDIFHFHHGLWTNPSVVLAAAEFGIPILVNVHDYHLICPRTHLFDRWKAYCGVPSDEGTCDACISGDAPSRIAPWRELGQQVLHCADRVIVPDPSVVDLLARAVPLPEGNRIEVVEAIPTEPERLFPSRREDPGDLRGRVLVPGRIEAHHKGGLIVGEFFDRLVAHGLEVHSVGSEEIRPRGGVVVHGGYPPGELPQVAAEIDPDLAVIPSLVPETFSLTLSELWAAGVPVLARAEGAIARRLTESGAGWTTNASDAGGFADVVLRLFSEPRSVIEAGRKATLAARSAVGSRQRVVNRYREIYRELVGERRPAPA